MTPELARAVVDEAARRAAVPRYDYVPHEPTPKQAEFRALRGVRQALYGGAAGGGKSDELLAEALEYVHVPGYSALLLRRTFPQLSMAGGLIPRAHEWLSNRPGARWVASERCWFFETGGAPARLQFGHLQHEDDKYNYQGGEFQFIGFDELTQFTATQYKYLFSRCRRPKDADKRTQKALARVPLRVRAGSNPGGVGHDWVKAHFVGPGTPGVVFFPARLEDNPHLDQASYRESLAVLDELTRRQLELGEWVRDQGGIIYPYTLANLIEAMPDLDDRLCHVLSIDLGASQREPTTAMVLLAYHPTLPGVWVRWAKKFAGMIPSSLAEAILEVDEDLELDAIVMDEGALGKGYGEEYRQRWKIPVEPAEKKNKLGYRKLLRGGLERTEVLFVEDECKDLLDEMGSLAWNEDGTDNEKGASNHLTDALLYGWRRCPAYLHEPPKPRLADDADEYAAEMRRRDIAAAKRRTRRQWWAR